ncbi:iron ABC transporter permease [Micromonospora sp. RTP1Z1]|uniref:ABC transporter permease n=1 Tax=Micromonospora sp. RTP1Z1 TaxID=2994043 RepID=UPI0029C8818C|nr:iron ABC transporter permease [Micromonospora sp. RTP1Z1]
MTASAVAIRRWGARARAYPTGVAAFSLLVALLALVPLFFVAWFSASVGFDEARRLIFRPRVGELLRNTVTLTVATTLLCAVVGTGAAWLVERTSLPGRRLWHVLLAAPLAVPAFVNSFGWVSLTASVQGYAGAVLVVTLSYFPLVYLPVAATLHGLDPALEESAQALGHGPVRTFARVVVPQLRPAMLGGMLLVGLHLLAEFGALQMLRFPTFTTGIYEQYQATFGGPAATMLASVLVLLCLLLLLAELWMRGRHRYARLGSGAARPAARVQLGRYTPLALGSVAGLTALALGVPLGSLLYWLAIGSSTTFPLGELATAALTSVGLGAAGAVVTTLLAIPVAWLAVRHRSRFSTVVERSTYFGHALPGIVVALALVTISIRYAQPIYQTTTLLIVAYAVLFLPLSMVSVQSALVQAPPSLDDAARSLGTGRLGVLRRVTLPLVAPGLGAGAALVFLAVVTELTATLLLAPIGTTTLATQFWSNSDSIAYGAAAPYAALMVGISIPASYLLTRFSKKVTPR